MRLDLRVLVLLVLLPVQAGAQSTTKDQEGAQPPVELLSTTTCADYLEGSRLSNPEPNTTAKERAMAEVALHTGRHR